LVRLGIARELSAAGQDARKRKKPGDEFTPKAEKINEAYLGRVLRLTLLSPAITEAILSGCQPSGLELADLLKPFPIEWDKQEALFKRGAS
jgi:hypothetical protein